VPELLVSCLGNCLLYQCIQNYSSLYLLSDIVCLVLCWGFWSTLELRFVQGNRYGSISLILHADIRLDLHHFFWRCFLSSVVWFLLHCQISSVCTCVDLFLGPRFNSIDQPVFMSIQCYFYYCSMALPEMRNGNISKSSFIVQDFLAILGLFVCLFVCLFPIWSWELLFQGL